MLTLLGLASATAQKTIVSKKTPVTPPQGGMDMAGMPPSEDMELSLILLGDSCMDSYDTHAALTYYQQAYNESQTLETRQKLANCLYQRCDYRQCAALLIGLPTASMSHDALHQLFFCYGYLKADKQLVSCGQQLIQRFPMDAEVLARMCTVLCDQDKAGEAVALARNYSRLDSTNLLINRTLANALYLDRQFRPAIGQYEKLLNMGDTTYLALYSLGMSYDYLGEKQQAYDYLLLANNFSKSQHAGCLYRLGMLSVELKYYKEALEYLYNAKFKLEPDKRVMKLIYDHLAKAYYATGSYELAYHEWKHARECDGTTLSYVYNIALCCVAIYEQGKAEKPDIWGTAMPRILQEALDYFNLFLEMADGNGMELDDETLLMIQEANKYIKRYTTPK